MAGLTSAGFIPKTRIQLAEELRASLRTQLGQNLLLDPSEPLGAVTDIFAGALHEGHEELQNVFSAGRLISASGASLDAMALEYGLVRAAARASVVTITVNGAQGTVIPAGSAIQLGPNEVRWLSQAAVTIDATGVGSVDFVAEETGPIVALAGSEWQTATPISGWTSASNLLDAQVGRDIEIDSALRARALVAAQGGGANSATGIRAAMLRVADVTEVVVIENSAPVADVDGRPANTTEVVMRGGDDAAIAVALWRSKPSGAGLVSTVAAGNRRSVPVVDEAGETQTVVFSRPETVQVFVEVDYVPRAGFPSDGAERIRDAILGFGSALVIGNDVYPTDIEQAIYCAFTPVKAFQRLELRIGLSANPPIAADVPTNRAQLAVFDSSRVTVTRV